MTDEGTGVGTIPLCAHCGRPVINQVATYWNGMSFHYACTRSPYEAQIGSPLPPPPKETKG